MLHERHHIALHPDAGEVFAVSGVQGRGGAAEAQCVECDSLGAVERSCDAAGRGFLDADVESSPVRQRRPARSKLLQFPLELAVGE